ncbi:hypothetical protein [Paenibacillus tepidiphilus]|uniref:hypothetical protein n=1 Tax=Paenibacillus tepidiphilus TaxID=2608683 RepID=UPI00123C305B|nr:hypothetical protein [Paenibacillus tepidiphilus]
MNNWRRNNRKRKRTVYIRRRYVRGWRELREAVALLLLVLALMGWPVFSVIFWLSGNNVLGPISLLLSLISAFVLYRALNED